MIDQATLDVLTQLGTLVIEVQSRSRHPDTKASLIFERELGPHLEKAILAYQELLIAISANPRIDYARIPVRTMAALRRYIDSGCPTGGFLHSVLSNDLFGAVGRADNENLAALPDIVAWIYNEAPSPCHGSTKHVSKWIKLRGLPGYREALRAEKEAS